MISLARQALAVVRALGQLPDFCRHLAELELRVGQAEIDIDEFDRDLGRCEAVLREHHVGGPKWESARRGAR
jgi:hypothetical protein